MICKRVIKTFTNKIQNTQPARTYFMLMYAFKLVASYIYFIETNVSRATTEVEVLYLMDQYGRQMLMVSWRRPSRAVALVSGHGDKSSCSLQNFQIQQLPVPSPASAQCFLFSQRKEKQQLRSTRSVTRQTD